MRFPGTSLVRASIMLCAFLAVLLMCSGGALALASSESASTSEVVPTGEGTADWTVLIYMDGDNNLEPYMITNFLEMADVGSNADVNLVVQFDRIGGYSILYGDWVTCNRYYVTEGMTPTMDNAVQQLGEVNMADGNTFASFIRWGVTNYPADRYAVVIKDHGASWYGCCEDDTSNYDMLKLSEVQQGFDEFRNLTGGPIDLVIFDDCLMGSVEVATEFPGMMDYAVVSESVGWTNNFDYSDILAYLEASPSQPTSSLAAAVVSMMDIVDDIDYVTQCAAAYNMTMVPDLRTSFEDYCVELYRCFNSSGTDVKQARSFCSELYFMGASPSDLYDVIDLYQFVNCSMSYCNDTELSIKGGALLDLLGPSGGSSSSFIIAERHTAACGFCHGMSIYMPDDIDVWRSYTSSYATSCYCGSTSVYGDFLWDLLLPYTSASLTGTEGDNGWYTSSVTATLSATSGTAIKYTYYSLDSGSWTKYTGAISVTGEGTHTLQYRSTDGYNNVESTRNLLIKIDSVAPIVSGNASENNVTIESYDSTSGIAAVLYRVDGGSWTEYTGTFTLTDSSNDQFVEFYAVDAAGNPSTVGSLTVIGYDDTPPTTSANLSGTQGTNGWYTSQVSVTLTAVDTQSGVMSTNYSIDGGSWTEYIGTFTITAEGTHTVEFRSIDNFGNPEVVESIIVKIDTTAPLAWHSLSGYDLTISSSDACSGVYSVVYRIDGGDWVLYTGTFAAGEDGWIRHVEYFALDNAGNPSVTGTLTIGTVDGFAPVTTSTVKGTAGTNGWYVSNVRVTLTATDDGGSGVKTIHYSLDGGSWFAYMTTLQITTSGVHSIYYYSEDNYGNIGATGSVLIYVDTIGPTISANVTGNGSGNYYNGTVSVDLDMTDNVSGAGTYYYRINGGAWTSAEKFSLASEGTFLIEFYGKDAAGNSAGVSSFTVVIDMTRPSASISVIGLNDDGWGNDTVNVSISGADGGSGISAIMYRVNGGNWTEYSSGFGFDADGTYLIECYAIDRSGNSGTICNVTCKVDMTAPEGSADLTGLIVEGRYVNNLTLELIFTDEGSGLSNIFYSLDDGDWTIYEGPLTVNEKGLHMISYYAVDELGNIGEAAETNFTLVTATVPGQVVDLSVNEVDGSLVLNWTLLDDGGLVPNYNIFRSSGDGEMVLIATVDEQAYTDITVEKGVDYTYCVAAVNQLGEGSLSSEADGHLADGSDGYLMYIVIAAVAIVLVLAIVFVIRRRRRS